MSNDNRISDGQDSTQLKILQLLNTISGALNNSNTNANTGNNAAMDATKKKKKKRKPRYDTSKYCWSHGAWNHLGKNCVNKKDGHKDEATFKNKMMRSTEFCQPCS